MNKKEALGFIRFLKVDYGPRSHGYKILCYLEDLVNKQGGKNNGTKEAKHKKS